MSRSAPSFEAIVETAQHVGADEDVVAFHHHAAYLYRPDVGALCPGAAIVGVEHVGAVGGGQHSPAADADIAHGGEE